MSKPSAWDRRKQEASNALEQVEIDTIRLALPIAVSIGATVTLIANQLQEALMNTENESVDTWSLRILGIGGGCTVYRIVSLLRTHAKLYELIQSHPGLVLAAADDEKTKITPPTRAMARDIVKHSQLRP